MFAALVGNFNAGLNKSQIQQWKLINQYLVIQVFLERQMEFQESNLNPIGVNWDLLEEPAKYIPTSSKPRRASE